LATIVSVPTGMAGGTVTIAQNSLTTTSPPPGCNLLGEQVQITAPVATPANPLILQFTLDPSITSGQTASTIAIYRTE
jgi:hypothetical protein